MATRGRPISILLIDGVASGRIKASIANWTGVAYRIPRKDLESCREREHLKQSGIYFLFGTDTQSDDNVVYIGQANTRSNGEGILNRLCEHNRNPDKDYWTEAVAITTSDNSLTSTEISYLENKFYNLAKDSRRYIVMNGNEPTQGNITEEIECQMENFAENVILLMGVLGHKVFEPLLRTLIEPVQETPAENEQLLYFKGANFSATGRYLSDGFVVMSGSKLNPNISNSCPNSAKVNRQKYATQIKNFTLTDDVYIKTPSSAASFVCGYSCNGYSFWKTADGKPLNQL